jgi:hypothetical protein
MGGFRTARVYLVVVPLEAAGEPVAVEFLVIDD